ncbi:hypothetical protein SAMN04488057_105209 [Cyclobacterium lianum]|uniref:Uncharacterized protein n=1 Tax=Cyclobacterium lianum TaxID=388280 RepID=A0A1M7NCH9_9BACT|nr:hypothetical protein SAMN04488057_105209 [Cyclobacterium lianum]
MFCISYFHFYETLKHLCLTDEVQNNPSDLLEKKSAINQTFETRAGVPDSAPLHQDKLLLQPYKTKKAPSIF